MAAIPTGGGYIETTTKNGQGFILNGRGFLEPAPLGEKVLKLDGSKTYTAQYTDNSLGYTTAALKEISDEHYSKEKMEKYQNWPAKLNKYKFSIEKELDDLTPRTVGSILHGKTGSFKSSICKYIMTLGKMPIIVPHNRMEWPDLNALIECTDAKAMPKVAVFLDEADTKWNLKSDHFSDFLDSGRQTRVKYVFATTNNFADLNLTIKNLSRSGRIRYIFEVPTAPVEDTLVRHISDQCANFKDIDGLVRLIDGTIVHPSEDTVKCIVEECMKWNLHKKDIITNEEFLEMTDILNIEMKDGLIKFANYIPGANQIDAMSVKQIARKLVDSNKARKSEEEMKDEMVDSLMNYIDRNTDRKTTFNF